jgi:hypothetical protein
MLAKLVRIICPRASNLNTEPEHVEFIITTGKADALLLDQSMLCNQRWALDAAGKSSVKTAWPL